MKYVYCLTRHLQSIGPLPSGLNDMKVYQVSFGGLTALVSDIERLPQGTTPLNNAENALVCQSVVQAAMNFCASIIPCRFGTIFANEEEILSCLRKHHALLEEQLARLDGKIEVSIRALFNGGMDVAVTPKAEHEELTAASKYLLEKKQKFDSIKRLGEKAEHFSLKLNEATTPFWAEVASQKRPMDNNKILFSLYYLVDQEKLSAFKRAYQEFKERWPELKLLYTGPWPPYNFADINLRN